MATGVYERKISTARMLCETGYPEVCKYLDESVEALQAYEQWKGK